MRDNSTQSNNFVSQTGHKHSRSRQEVSHVNILSHWEFLSSSWSHCKIDSRSLRGDKYFVSEGSSNKPDLFGGLW